MSTQPPYVLVICDGWGVAPPSDANAATQAATPNLARWEREYPHTTVRASGDAVGLTAGQDGNSEAGHMNIGAGRIVPQDDVIVSASIANGTFFRNPAFGAALHHVQKHNSTLHLMGLLSTRQSAHSNPDHLLALLMLAQNHQLKNIRMHLFTDGRDSPRYMAREMLTKHLPHFGDAKVATICGRYYAMDRNKVWSRTEQAYQAITEGKAEHRVDDALQAVTQAYNRAETDEFIAPTVIDGYSGMNDHDAIIYFNLRSDRTRQLTKAFVQKDFEQKNAATHGFTRSKVIQGLTFVAMTEFGPDLASILTAFPAAALHQTLPMVLRDLRQLYIAESEKYAHVTYFFNGGYADPVGGEERVMIPSPAVPIYDQTPAMSSQAITDRVVASIQHRTHDFIVINFAQTDMVAHTGNLEASRAAMEATDACLGRLEQVVLAAGGTMVVTGDHGNIEELLNQHTGEIDTEHSSNPVPLYIISDTHRHVALKSDGVLGDIAPTILKMMGRESPKEMTGKSLIV